MVDQHDGRGLKTVDQQPEKSNFRIEENSIEQLEMDVTRVLKEKKLKKKISSRTSSLDSSCPPGTDSKIQILESKLQFLLKAYKNPQN